ncbi:hypothetical protein GCM10028803_51720 [Larkinella knui]|uniref:Uncharacterized protein n=1 Tax=Larkinella knui TaxID=2025310 RepID=A0A3P1CH08_9BACT|nr:hypothetical protein [Larkinella knui]RRB12612.1 hypothetical protein EHT87_20695 [Larkinella knui]
MKSEQEKKKLAYFRALSFQEQLNTVWQTGILLDTKRLPGFWLHLYAVNTFFVELWICQRRLDVTLVRGFSNTEELKPYIDRISLDSILS